MPKLKAGIQLDAADKQNFNLLVADLLTIGSRVDKVIETEAKRTVKKMRKDVRKDTRRLKDSISYTKKKENHFEFHASAVNPDNNQQYADRQEFGPAAGFDGAYTPYFFGNLRGFQRETINSMRSLLATLLQIKGNR